MVLSLEECLCISVFSTMHENAVVFFIRFECVHLMIFCSNNFSLKRGSLVGINILIVL